MKKCSKCKKEYNTDMFVKCKAGKDGLKTVCKKCQKEYRSEYYLKNKEKEIEKAITYNREHKEKRFRYMEKYRQENKEQLKKYTKEYYAQNKEERKGFSMEYYYTHKEERNKYARKWKKQNRGKLREYERDKLKNDVNYKIAHYARNRVNVALRDGGSKKTKHTKDLIGCSVDFLKKYLESKFQDGMTWENYGYFGWHVDHIKPCNSFDLTIEEKQKECFHYTNLQPLWWKDNLSKSDKIKL